VRIVSRLAKEDRKFDARGRKRAAKLEKHSNDVFKMLIPKGLCSDQGSTQNRRKIDANSTQNRRKTPRTADGMVKKLRWKPAAGASPGSEISQEPRVRTRRQVSGVGGPWAVGIGGRQGWEGGPSGDPKKAGGECSGRRWGQRRCATNGSFAGFCRILQDDSCKTQLDVQQVVAISLRVLQETDAFSSTTQTHAEVSGTFGVFT
jgi:hypothetical protein